MGLILAAGSVPPFLPVLAVVIVTAAVSGWLCQRVGLVPIVGFLTAGVLIGPNALAIVDEVHTVELVAEIGVLLLLFIIGIEFSLERLARVKRLVLGGGSITVALAIAATAAVVLATGGGWKPAVYTGLLVSVSSTAVVLALLASRHATATPTGQTSVAVLVFEDLAVVGMVLVVPMLGTDGGSAAELVKALAIAVGVIAAVLVVARRVMPHILEAVARLCSSEVFLLAVLAICFATAYLTSLAGVSVSLGAFLAGLVVSESRFSAHALGEVLPLQIVFTATFFVSVGMLLDPAFLIEQPLLVAVVVGVVLVIKCVTGTIGARLVGVALPVAVASALLRAQIGEFSFVLQQVGHEAGLTPGDLGERGVQAFLAASVLLMVATPALMPAGAWLGGRLARGRPATEAAESSAGDESPAELEDHVVVAGYGAAARELVPRLRDAGAELVVITLNPGGAEHAEITGAHVLRGDSTKERTLSEAGIRRARVVVVPDDDPDTAARITALVRSMNPTATIVVRADGDGDIDQLGSDGADVVVTAPRAAIGAFADSVLREVAGGSLEVALDRVIRFRPQPSACGHVAGIRPVLPSARGCTECLQLGDPWTHLRVCLTCGHVGCCNSSKNRHARGHAAESGHAIARSFEPGERWAWCFPDELELAPIDPD